MLVEGRDFADAHDALGRSLGLSDAGAVLVRPDGHVAAIFRDLDRDGPARGDLARGDLSGAIAASLAANLSASPAP